MVLFPDDTHLFISHNDPVYLNDTLNSELNNLSTWFATNRLSLNLSKDKFYGIQTSAKKQKLLEFHVSINEQPIPRVSETMHMHG